MRYGDTMGRDGESLALKLWRGSAVAAPTVPKHRQLVYCETPGQYTIDFFQVLLSSLAAYPVLPLCCIMTVVFSDARWIRSPLLASLYMWLLLDVDNGPVFESTVP